MKITREIINDLLPIYFSDECSSDTKQLVEEYLKSDPEFGKQVEQYQQNPIPDAIPETLEKGDEMKSLLKTRRMLKIRSYLMGFAIFCTLVSFSFLHTNGKTYMLMNEAPYSAAVYAILGAGFWIAYFVFKQKGSDI